MVSFNSLKLHDYGQAKHAGQYSPGTNDAFVTMALGKEKFQTTVVEQASSEVEWREQADL